MGFFAKKDNENIVVETIYIEDESDAAFDAYIHNVLGLDGIWVSATTPIHHANYAEVGFKHYPELNAFISPKPFESWTLEHNSFSGEYYWEPPVTYPEDGMDYTWDEASLSWKLSNS